MSTSTVSSTAATEAWGLVWRIFSADKPRRMVTLNELGLAPMQAMALTSLQPGEPMPMSALAERLFCDASNVTGIADRLETRGLVRRESLAGDRRVKALTITPSGIKLRRQVMNLMSEPPDAIAALSDVDQRALRDILARAVEHLRAAGESEQVAPQG